MKHSLRILFPWTGIAVIAGVLLTAVVIEPRFLGFSGTSVDAQDAADATPTNGGMPGHDESMPGMEMSEADHQGMDMTGTPTAEQQAAADKLVKDVIAETSRFRDFAVAQKEGYVQITPHNRRGWGAAHFHNATYAADGVLLDPNRPEDLIYLKMPDGAMKFLGVMFLAPPGKGPDIGGPLTMWHSHDNLCLAPGANLTRRVNGQCIGGGVPITQEMMHVWVFNHPEGPFAHMLGRDGLLAALEQFSAADAPADATAAATI